MYADTTQLGWDPTMERVSTRHHVGQVDYIIKFRNVRYRTVRLISDIGAEAIRGRGTRVWEVRQLNKNDEEDPTPLVLKDSWADAQKAFQDSYKDLQKSYDAAVAKVKK